MKIEVTKPIPAIPKDLCIVGQPKIGKSAIVADLTLRNENSVILDLEKGGYDYLEARRIPIYKEDTDTMKEAYKNYVTVRDELVKSKTLFDFLIIDNITELDALSEIGGTYLYMNTVQGKKFNREGDVPNGRKIEYGEKEWRAVSTLPDGNGYQYTRTWFLNQFDIFRSLAKYRIYIGHISDKYISDSEKDIAVTKELFLTGKLKLIFASRVTSIAKLKRDENKRILDFNVVNDSIIAGSRIGHLKGEMVISEVDENGKLKTYWEKIYNNLK